MLVYGGETVAATKRVFLSESCTRQMVKQPVAILQADRLLLFWSFLIEMIEEGGDACERRFLLVFDLDGKFDFHFADATEVGNGL